MTAAKGKFAVSPYKHVMINGVPRAFITFDTKQKAQEFIKERRLKKALIYKHK